MQPIEQKILQTFSKHPGRDLSTTELVQTIFREEYEKVRDYVYNPQKDKETEKLGKRKKARLHRKLLYYLNKLEEENIIKLTRTEGRGEKFFVLNSEITPKTKREKQIETVIKSVSTMEQDELVLSGLESYEDARIVKRFDSKNWVSRINALIVEPIIGNSLKEIYNKVTELYPSYNDVLGLNDFNELIDKEDLQDLTAFIKKLNIDTKDYNKYVNLHIDVSKIKDTVKSSDFFASYAEINPEKIFVLFRLNSKTLLGHTRFIKQIIKHFSENKIRINLQNIDLKVAPILIGRAGAYTFGEEEWQKYQQTAKGKTIGLCSSETSLYVDVDRFFQENRSFSEFREFILKSSRALLHATTIQRKKSDVLFKTLNELNGVNQSKFFDASYNYIRLWNYVVDDKGKNKDQFENFEAVLKVCSDELAEFCKAEETIYVSCGIPIRFKVVLSSAFKRFDKGFLSPRKYKKVTIKSINDFSSGEIVEYLKLRERLNRIFEGGDRVRFFRAINFTQDETLNEFNYLLTNFYFPLFTYDFNTRKGEVTLDNFI